MQGDESAAAARRRAFIEQELPELWPTQESMDEAAALRALARRLSAQLEAHDKRPKPMQVPRGTPSPVIERGQMPRPEPVDCADGQEPPRFGMRSGPLRRGKMPKRPRKVVTYMFPRLRGGMQVEDGELLTGLRSLRGALSRGLVPQIDLPSARKPVMMEGPPAPPSSSAWDPAEVFKPGVVDVRLDAPPTVRLRYRSTTIELPTDWVTGYLREYIATRGTVPHDASEGVVSGTGFVLDTFWPRFRARVAGLPRRRSTYGRLIGCWMLPYTVEEGMPTSLFFQTAGEQRAVHDLACQLLHAYVDFARVPRDQVTRIKLIDDDGWCDGLSEFIRGTLEGEPRAQLFQGDAIAFPFPNIVSTCADARIQYTNKSAAVHGEEPWEYLCTSPPPPTSDEFNPYSFRCGQVSVKCGGMRDATLLQWDDYNVELRAVPFAPAGARRSRYVWLADEESAADSKSPWPRGDSTSTACNLGALRSVQFTPAHVAFDAELLDLLLFMAQLCLDRHRYLVRIGGTGSPTRAATRSLEAGQAFSGYALGVIASRSAVLVHELGHMYMGGMPHAGFMPGDGRPRWRSCFDLARRELQARVIAENGLPIYEYVANLAADTYAGVSSVSSLTRGVDVGGPTNERRFDLAEPFYVRVFHGIAAASCSSVPFGAEDPFAIASREIGASPAGCVGRVWVQFTRPASTGGGYIIRSTQGCSCEETLASPIFTPFDPRELTLASPCYLSAPAVGATYAST
ncbi:MAG: hypothetical protein JNM72_02535 [Deltaproteobacteria bacterium]|nr:hypothetical protein [Deltaproteobacteria bacterium]